MLIFTATWGLPQRYLVTDLMSYDGLPNKDSLSPYQGMASVLYSNLRIKKTQIDPAAAIKSIEQTCADYNPIAQGVLPGEYQRVRDRPPEDQIPIRLEDIDYGWVYAYTLQLIIGFKDRGNATAYALGTQTAPGFEDAESGDVVSATDMLVDTESQARADLNTMKARLPFLLKKIHELSKKFRVHLISYLKLWYSSKESFTVLPAPRDILSEGLLLKMGADGNPDGYFPASANSGRVFPAAKAFMDGSTGDPDYQYIREFIQVLNALGLNIMNEDPRKFDQAFMDNIIVTYIESNKEFMIRGRRRSPRVYAELGAVSVSDWTKNTDAMVTSAVSNFVAKLQFNEALVARINQSAAPASAMNYFMQMYFMFANDVRFCVRGEVYKLYVPKDVPDDSRQAPNMDCVEDVEGFVALPGEDSPYAFSLRCMKYGGDKQKAILTTSGKLILVRKGVRTEYIPVATASAYIAAYAQSKGAPSEYLQLNGESVRWGTWSELFL